MCRGWWLRIGRFKVAWVLTVFLLTTLFGCIVAAVISLLLIKRKSSWSRRRKMFAAALPLPVVIWVLSGILIITTFTAPKDRCGVDICGMIYGLGIWASIGAVFIFSVSMACAWLVERVMKQ